MGQKLICLFPMAVWTLDGLSIDAQLLFQVCPLLDVGEHALSTPFRLFSM